MKKKRIFWLGMHKILSQTELPTLRDMGYEVFNPPYLSDIRDQSAVTEWIPGQTTLPKKIHDKLAKYNFFYNQINEEIAAILNDYFDAVIVTINPDWLVSVIKIFKKTVIYRTYGGIGIVSDGLLANGGYRLIQDHRDFCFLPHCAETAADEHSWLKERMRVVPYWLTDDVFSLRGQWPCTRPKKAEIGLTCPNVSNAYYNAHFNYLKSHFEQRCFRYYGTQLEENADPNIAGTLPRDVYLGEFLHLSGYLYTYRERNVCYLPPVEMMVLGGPVLYFPGSLLHRYFKTAAPGLVKNEREAHQKAKRLIQGDSDLVQEIVASQGGIIERYSKSFGLPVFLKTIRELLDKKSDSRSVPVLGVSAQSADGDLRPVLLFAHFTDAYSFLNGEYSTIHGIPRVMRQWVRALNELNIPVVVTAFRGDLINTRGFYASHCRRPDLVSAIAVDDLDLGVVSPIPPSGIQGKRRRVLNWAIQKSSVLKNIRDRYKKHPAGLGAIENFLIRFYQAITYKKYQAKSPLSSGNAKKNSSDRLALDSGSPASLSQRWRYVIIPHYYLFPEALKAGFPRVLAYIPDYIPHFFKGRHYFPDNELHVQSGCELAKLSTIVLTNSKFTAGYLPDCGLAVPKDKIVSFPMPFLSMNRNGNEDLADYRTIDRLAGKKFIFYPTQPHPNKRLDLLVRSWLLVNKLRPDLRIELAITSGFLPECLWSLAREEKLESRIHLFPGINDATLGWLYQNAVCLALTSELEGNIPTQLIEALQYQCPVVAMENPLITGELGKISERLVIVPFADVAAFADGIVYAEENRANLLKSQSDVLEYVKELNSFKSFKENVMCIDRRMGGMAN